MPVNQLDLYNLNTSGCGSPPMELLLRDDPMGCLGWDSPPRFPAVRTHRPGIQQRSTHYVMPTGRHRHSGLIGFPIYLIFVVHG